MNKLRLITIAVSLLAAYLLLCIGLSTRSSNTVRTESSSRAFLVDRPLEELLSECAEELKQQYGEDLEIELKGVVLTYATSFPRAYGFVDVTDTIILKDDGFGEDRTCYMSSSIEGESRSAPFLLAPVHYLVHFRNDTQFSVITQYIAQRLATSAKPVP